MGGYEVNSRSGGDIFACARTLDMFLDVIAPEKLNINDSHYSFPTKDELRSFLVLCLGSFLWWGRHQRGPSAFVLDRKYLYHTSFSEIDIALAFQFSRSESYLPWIPLIQSTTPE